VAIVIRKIITPIFHVILIWYLLKYRPRPIWVYRAAKNSDAPLAWIRRVCHPELTSRIIWDRQSKANKILEE